MARRMARWLACRMLRVSISSTEAKPTRRPTIRFNTQVPTESLTEGIIASSTSGKPGGRTKEWGAASAAEETPDAGGGEPRKLGAANDGNEQPLPDKGRRVARNVAAIVEEMLDR